MTNLTLNQALYKARKEFSHNSIYGGKYQGFYNGKTYDSIGEAKRARNNDVVLHTMLWLGLDYELVSYAIYDLSRQCVNQTELANEVYKHCK